MGTDLGATRTAPRSLFMVMSWLVGGALFMLTPRLHAQQASGTAQPTRQPPPAMVRVLVATDERGLRLTVTPTGCRNAPESDSACPEQRAIISCYQYCELWAPPGNYTLRGTNAAEHIDYKLTLHVDRDSAFHVSSGNRGERIAGLVTGIAGPIMVLGGTLLWLDGASKAQCDACASHSTELGGGIALGFLGLLVTPIGWVMFANNRTRADLEVDDSAVRAPPVQFGIRALPRGGWGLGLSTQF
jgi:hypothetical protein